MLVSFSPNQISGRISLNLKDKKDKTKNESLYTHNIVLLFVRKENRMSYTNIHYCIETLVARYFNRPKSIIKQDNLHTVINLLCSFYCEHSGAVMKGNVNIRNVHGSYRQTVTSTRRLFLPWSGVFKMYAVNVPFSRVFSRRKCKVAYAVSSKCFSFFTP